MNKTYSRLLLVSYLFFTQALFAIEFKEFNYLQTDKDAQKEINTTGLFGWGGYVLTDNQRALRTYLFNAQFADQKPLDFTQDFQSILDNLPDKHLIDTSIKTDLLKALGNADTNSEAFKNNINLYLNALERHANPDYEYARYIEPKQNQATAKYLIDHLSPENINANTLASQDGIVKTVFQKNNELEQTINNLTSEKKELWGEIYNTITGTASIKTKEQVLQDAIREYNDAVKQKKEDLENEFLRLEDDHGRKFDQDIFDKKWKYFLANQLFEITQLTEPTDIEKKTINVENIPVNTTAQSWLADFPISLEALKNEYNTAAETKKAALILELKNQAQAAKKIYDSGTQAVDNLWNALLATEDYTLQDITDVATIQKRIKNLKDIDIKAKATEWVKTFEDDTAEEQERQQAVQAYDQAIEQQKKVLETTIKNLAKNAKPQKKYDQSKIDTAWQQTINQYPIDRSKDTPDTIHQAQENIKKIDLDMLATEILKQLRDLIIISPEQLDTNLKTLASALKTLGSQLA